MSNYCENLFLSRLKISNMECSKKPDHNLKTNLDMLSFIVYCLPSSRDDREGREERENERRHLCSMKLLLLCIWGTNCCCCPSVADLTIKLLLLSIWQIPQQNCCCCLYVRSHNETAIVVCLADPTIKLLLLSICGRSHNKTAVVVCLADPTIELPVLSFWQIPQ